MLRIAYSVGPVFAVLLALIAIPRLTSASPNLALAKSDYPHGAKVVAVPATNAEADHFLRPVHKSTFERLHRLGGAGWLQFATWHFKTGAKKAVRSHLTLFGYAVNVFPNKGLAQKALADIKLRTTARRVGHLSARTSKSSGARETLVFIFFAYSNVEVESYYEYLGTAPVALSKQLGHLFSTQNSHLVHLVKSYLNTPPPPTALPETATPPKDDPTFTPTATATPTSSPVPATATPTASAMPTSAATATLTSVPPTPPVPTSTPTPPALQATAQMASPTYRPGDDAVLDAYVTYHGEPAQNVSVVVVFDIAGHFARGQTTTDVNGNATFSAQVPADTPYGTTATVEVQATDAENDTAFAQTSFIVSK